MLTRRIAVAVLFASLVGTACGGSPDAASDDPSSDSAQEADALTGAGWRTGGDVGHGVASKDTGNPLGNNVFIAYAGYNVSLASARVWAAALYTSTLRARGVRHIYAVQGPADPGYNGGEIGNSQIARALDGEVNSGTKFILIAGHSSGSFVADELIEQLDTGHDPRNVTANKVVFFNLEGGQKGVSNGAIARLRKAYYVGAHDSSTGTFSPNHATMKWLGSTFAHKGGFIEYDARGARCFAGAVWCLHVSLVTTRPHDRSGADAAHDYSDFGGRPVNHTWIDDKAQEAGLVR